MNKRVIVYVLGAVLLIEAALMLLPLLVAVIYREKNGWYFLWVLLGAAVGWMLARFFEAVFARGRLVRNSMKVIVVLSAAFLLMAAEEGLKGALPLSGLLAVMSMACVLRQKGDGGVAARLSEKFGKLWLAAEVILFVLVGAAAEQGDAAALQIVEKAGRELALLVRPVAEKLGLQSARIAFAGSVLQKCAPVRSAAQTQLQTLLPQLTLAEPQGDAAAGAVLLARCKAEE